MDILTSMVPSTTFLLKVSLFIIWGMFCFWVGRRPDQATAAEHDLWAVIKDLFTKSSKVTPPNQIYADVYDLMTAVGKAGYSGAIVVDQKIVRTGDLPGANYKTTQRGVELVVA